MGESEDSPPVPSQASSHNENMLFEKVEHLMAEAQSNLQENLNLRKLLEETQELNRILEIRMQRYQTLSEHRPSSQPVMPAAQRLSFDLQQANSDPVASTVRLPFQSDSVPILHANINGTSHANPNQSTLTVRADLELKSGFDPTVGHLEIVRNSCHNVSGLFPSLVQPVRTSAQSFAATPLQFVRVPPTSVGTSQSISPSNTPFRPPFFDPTTSAFLSSTNMPSSQTIGPFSGGLPPYSSMHPFFITFDLSMLPLLVVVYKIAFLLHFRLLLYLSSTQSAVRNSSFNPSSGFPTIQSTVLPTNPAL
jgi:hypothetical protein